jgi:hypothetical protein
MTNAEFNLQLQQWNKSSLRRSERFIAAGTHQKHLAPLGAKRGSEAIAERTNVDCAPPELRLDKEPPRL